MRITYLELENIKSYGPTTKLDLTAGINAVCGLNGSGKSTVLEAIGYALFNFLPYNQQAFLREGARSGTIRVGLLARDDREYQVVRRIGAGNPYYVCDAETGSRLAERREDVLTWIRQYALDIDGEVDLEALFKNAVGVPQGLMTSDFQQTPGARKSIFDPLLRVEEYRDAYEYLRETVSYLRATAGQMDEEIARLEGETGKMAELEQRDAELSRQASAIQQRLDRLISDLQTLEERKAEMEAVERRLRELRTEVRTAESEVKRHSDLLRFHRERLADSQRAQQIVEEAEAGYQTVVEARNELTTLESQRRERDTLKTSLARAQTEQQGVFGRIEQLDKEVNRATEAADEAAALADAAARQNALELRLRENQSVAQRAARLDAECATLRTEIEEVQRRQEAQERRIATARDASQRVSALPSVQGSLERVSGQLAELRPLRAQAEEVKEQGIQLRTRQERLQAQVEQRRALEGRIAALAPVAATLEGLIEQEEELRDRRARVVAAIEYQQVAQGDLVARHCPLLELQCPVVTADASVLDRFDARRVDLLGQQEELDRMLASAQDESAGARTAVSDLQELKLQAAGLERAAAELAETAGQLEKVREQYQSLADTVKREPELKAQQASLLADLEELQEAARRASELSLLSEQFERDAGALKLHRTALIEREEERAVVRRAKQEMEELTAQLRLLDDPRGRQQQLLALAVRRQSLEADMAREHQALKDAGDRVKAISGQLHQFDALDTQIEALQRLAQEHQEAYDRFMGHREAAEELSARQEVAAHTEAALAAAETARSEVARMEETVAAGYDAEAHPRLKDECDEAGKAVVHESTSKEHVEGLLADVGNQLAALRRQQEKLLIRRGERRQLESVREAVDFIRETIRAAGPAVTETLLRNISQGANDVFAEIMDDHAAELRWDRDYEVVVQRGTETRRFTQLSGGEQMSAALAVRLALLKEMSDVDFAFFDEPTQNMDVDRRSNLADQIRQIRGFEQLIVISHDDTFEHHTDNLIRLRKVHEETMLEPG